MRNIIYTRKSKYSDKSESIESQIEYCKQISKMRYPDIDDFNIYVDEGFTGQNTKRPQYQLMLNEIKKSNDFKAVICYKIDRISRSLVDFTNLQQTLSKKSVFIMSASEGFDTSTPWGEAVLNILMIFAQLERNNISERIRDTMLHYAKMGRWTGGLTPLGFESKSVPYKDAFDQDKNMVILSPVENEIRIIKTIYSKYLELQSFNAVEQYLVQHNINTRKGCLFSVATIREIVRNPVYSVADKDLYDYLRDKGAEICNDESEFNGSYSVIPYNRMDKKKDVRRPVAEWVIAISRHRGVVSGKDWVKAQRIIDSNSAAMPRLGTAQYGIFSGLIKCAKCGSTMRVKNGRVYNDESKKEYYYVCHLKEVSKQRDCDMRNIIGHRTEPELLNRLEEYAKNANLQNELAHKNKITLSVDMVEQQEAFTQLKSLLNEKEAAIKNLVMQLSKTDDLTAGRYITEEITGIDKDIVDLKQRMAVIELELSEKKSREMDMLSLLQSFEQIKNIAKITDTVTQRRLMKALISHMEWDGKNIRIFFRTGETINFNQYMERGDFSSLILQTFNDHRFGFYPDERLCIKRGRIVE